MHGTVIFVEKSLDAKTSADAVGRVFSGAMDFQWCTDNKQLAVRGIWNRETDVLIKKPVSLWKKMCKGYQPIEGRDYEFKAVGVMKSPDVGCFGGDDDESDIDILNEIEWDAESSISDSDIEIEDNPFSWLIEAGALPEGTRPTEPDKGFWQPDGTWADNPSYVPPADAPISRAEVVEDALEEDAESALWALARSESSVSAMRQRVERVSFHRYSDKVSRRAAVMHGARPEIIRYDLAPDVVLINGVFCQVVGVKVVQA